MLSKIRISNHGAGTIQMNIRGVFGKQLFEELFSQKELF